MTKLEPRRGNGPGVCPSSYREVEDAPEPRQTCFELPCVLHVLHNLFRYGTSWHSRQFSEDAALLFRLRLRNPSRDPLRSKYSPGDGLDVEDERQRIEGGRRVVVPRVVPGSPKVKPSQHCPKAALKERGKKVLLDSDLCPQQASSRRCGRVTSATWF